MEIFGPVRSRRFGLSLGINHLPPKVCTYACVYCQLGRTYPMTIQSDAYSQPEEVLQAVQTRLGELETPPDTLTFVSNGEPTSGQQPERIHPGAQSAGLTGGRHQQCFLSLARRGAPAAHAGRHRLSQS